MLLDQRMDKENVHLHNGVLHRRKKSWHLKNWKQMDGSIKYHIEWGNPDPERQICTHS